MPAQHRSRAAIKIQSSLDRQLGNQPSDVVFCRRCVVSNQRPRIIFDEEGVCSACRFAHEKHHVVDWSSAGVSCVSSASATVAPTADTT